MDTHTAQYQEQARVAYRRKDYAKALELFNRAIGRSPSLQLYDHRAACHERLGDFKEALKDAKKSIQLAREDPTGYVRAGRILVKMERKSTALEIYTLGLKNVKHVGQGFELLKKFHVELMTELSPPKRADPLTVLPRELAEQILGYLSFKQLMNTCLVSTGWTQFICRTPNLWWHLDLTHTKGKVKNAFVGRAIKIGRSKLRTATLSNLFDFDKALSALARTCPLEELNLRNTGLLAYEIVNILKPVKNLRTLRIHKGTSILWRALSDILLHSAETLDALVCEDLPITQSSSDLYFSERNFPNMRELDLSWSSGWRGSPSLVKSLANMSNLQSLKLHQLSNKESIVHDRVDLSMLTNLSHLDLLLDIRHAGHIILSSSIKSLAIGTWQPRHAKFFHPPAGIEPVKWSLPLLEELRICAAQVPFSDFEFALRTSFLPDTQTPVCLHKLSMTASGVRGNLNKETLSHPRLRELKHLSLERCFDTDDDCLSLVAKDLPKLEFLNVSGTDVTGAGIKKVVSNGLKKLVANNCRHVYPDAVQWARTQGVKVEHKMSDGMAGGKKLRH